MTRYLLDTDALIDFSKGSEPTTSRILSWIDASDVVAVCAISVAEFFAGLPASAVPRWEQFLSTLAYWDITRDAALRAGQDRFTLARAGRTITTTDALLAAVARHYQATLVTGNIKDFPTDDVRLLSIRPRPRTIGAMNDPELRSDQLEDIIPPRPPVDTDR